ncbi:hypothetical protein QTG56_08015 [Rossellomorea sp. AcN35-11]|nr:hypothetical protein [Rossellomorea aquimaris]WJV30923.1 hypothetical protein QTG56_08015 [Rossellomorea sp. AcN35-11]
MRRLLSVVVILICLGGCSQIDRGEVIQTEGTTEKSQEAITVPQFLFMVENAGDIKSYTMEILENHTLTSNDDSIIQWLQWKKKISTINDPINYHLEMTVEDIHGEPDPDVPNPIEMDMYLKDQTIYIKSNANPEWLIFEDAIQEVEEGVYKDWYQVEDMVLVVSKFSYQWEIIQDHHQHFLIEEEKDRYKLSLNYPEEELDNLPDELIELSLPNVESIDQDEDMQLKPLEYRMTFYYDKDSLYPTSSFILASYEWIYQGERFKLHYELNSDETNHNKIESITLPEGVKS